MTMSLKNFEKIRKNVEQSVRIRKNPKESERKNLKEWKESGIISKKKNRKNLKELFTKEMKESESI